MRVNERTIRETLCEEAEGAAPPPDMWERIRSELERDPQEAAVRALAERRYHRRSRGLMAAGVAAGILWLLVAPGGSTPELAEPAVIQVSPADPPVLRVARSQAASDLRWPSQEIALLR